MGSGGVDGSESPGVGGTPGAGGVIGGTSDEGDAVAGGIAAAGQAPMAHYPALLGNSRLEYVVDDLVNLVARKVCFHGVTLNTELT